MAPWIPVVVTLVLGLVGLGIQGLLLAYFVGRMKEQQTGQAALVAAFQKFTEQAITALTARMGAVDSFTSESKSDRAAITARLGGIEKLVEGMPQFREEFAAHRATSDAHQQRVEAELHRILQAQEGQQRQLANLALRSPGDVVSLPAAKGV
mgnify:CR=1 FL=1